ncbi:hypothetical protein C4578_00250 [Candidatus Microgenomates bacterium]|jgi:hypothetical protein|nr:MAG: hypothetical protein C4578_00250 [Candidatus Microgenomates bacterium]
MKKLFFLFLLTLGVFLFSANPALAVNNSCTDCCRVNCNFLFKLPNTVACYESGRHEIPGLGSEFYGTDVVKTIGCGGIIQYFCGTTPSGEQKRIISVWQVARRDTCPNGWVKVEDPHPEWGDYLVPGVDYCVHNTILPCPGSGNLSR